MTTTVRFWLDHTDVGKEGRWKMFSTGKSPTFSFWSPGQPDNHRGSQNCINNSISVHKDHDLPKTEHKKHMQDIR